MFLGLLERGFCAERSLFFTEGSVFFAERFQHFSEVKSERVNSSTQRNDRNRSEIHNDGGDTSGDTKCHSILAVLEKQR